MSELSALHALEAEESRIKLLTIILRHVFS